MPKNDTRAGRFPRFEKENFRKNLELAERLREIADEKGATPGQLALAWLLQRGDDIVPISGTKSRERLEENAAAVNATLINEYSTRIEEAILRGLAAGAATTRSGCAP